MVVQSPEYQGPDMTNFGLRSQSDPEFNQVYQAEMRKFNQRILDDPAFAIDYIKLKHHMAWWQSTSWYIFWIPSCHNHAT